MSVWCLEGVWKEYRGCLEVVWRVSGKGLEIFWMRSWRCLVISSGRENVAKGSHQLLKCSVCLQVLGWVSETYLEGVRWVSARYRRGVWEV